MAKQGSKVAEETKVSDGGLQECQVLMTEMMQMLLKQHRDTALQQAYTDCFILLTKHFYDQESPEIREFLGFTFKELLSKFLGGRFPATSGLKQKLFERVFEQCPSIGWSVIKTVLKCFLPKGKQDSEDASEKEEGSRGNHQRLQAIEMTAALIKFSDKDSSAVKLLGKNLGLLTSVVIKVV